MVDIDLSVKELPSTTTMDAETKVLTTDFWVLGTERKRQGLLRQIKKFVPLSNGSLSPMPYHWDNDAFHYYYCQAPWSASTYNYNLNQVADSIIHPPHNF